MFGVLVRVPFGEAGEHAVRHVAAAARPMFEGLPGLRSKVFTFDLTFHQIAEIVDNSAAADGAST